ncbi:MAG: SufE family protein [Chthoniobacteraceae bacterium]|nr:SufE family protein [Chthoniobacteraceae bacterium]
MSPRERQNALIARYAILPDAHERLAALTARRSKLAALPPEERGPEALVPGCISRVWLVPSLENGRCRFRLHAESALVKGLAAAICELYDDAAPEEVLATPVEFLEALGIAANLSPTRLNGLSNLQARIAAFARRCLPASSAS